MANDTPFKAKLRQLTLAGWRSIQRTDPPIEFCDINVFIGPNGSGKSNLVSFFRMLNRMIAGKLQEFIGTNGGAETLLYLGSKHTAKIEATLKFDSRDGTNRYFMRLMQAAGDRLIFSEERLEFQRANNPPSPSDVLGGGHNESLLKERAEEEKLQKARPPRKTKSIAQVSYRLLKNCRVFHFHDTSETARMRGTCYLNDNYHLQPDGGNLAAMLYLYQQTAPVAYRRIVATVRKIIPDFDDFALEPDRLNPNTIRLNWRQQGREYLFGPHQYSDGSLRAIALITLLLQPEDDLPDAIVLDEPELGLHPFGLELIAGLMRSVSLQTRIIAATQSASFLDHFEPEEIVVTESIGGATCFRRLDAEKLKDWLEDYTLSQLWERNVIGGGPMP